MRQRMGHAIDGDLRLLHRFEQRRLRLGRGAVDLVGQHELAMIGPGRNSNSPLCWLKIETPVTSLGSRSGVNWMRLKLQPIERAMDFASIVLPTPGTSSISTWPPHSTRNQREAHRLLLADDDALDICDDAIRRLTQVLYRKQGTIF